MRKHNPFLLIGLTGFVVTTVLFVSFLVGGISSGAEFWVLWFPSYVVWVVFMVIGAALGRKQARS